MDDLVDSRQADYVQSQMPSDEEVSKYIVSILKEARNYDRGMLEIYYANIKELSREEVDYSSFKSYIRSALDTKESYLWGLMFQMTWSHKLSVHPYQE